MNEFFRKHSWVVIAILLGILIAAGILRKPTPVEIEVVGQWEMDPLVVICPGSPFDIEDVREVLDRYEDRGHSFDGILEVQTCSDENVFGWIKLDGRGPRIEFDEAGHAYTRYNLDTGEIISSIIELDSVNILVLEHELGHALGYQHVNRSGHIMFPNVDGLGPNDEGMYREETDTA